MTLRREIAKTCGLAFLAATALGSWQVGPVSGQDAVVRVVAPSVWPPDGGSFEVRVEADGVANLAAFELKLAFDPVVLVYEGVQAGAFLGSTGRPVSCIGPDFFTLQRDVFSFACSSAGPDPAGASGAGVLMTARFRPAERGPSPLALNAVRLTDTSGELIPAAVEQGSVIIGVSAATPAPTATPVGTSPGPGRPTATPAAATSTATPLPTGYEALPLAAGCNLAASTYPEATLIQTIAGAVRPASILVALWELEEGAWMGYSPRFPNVSDLTDKGFMEPVFICVSAAGDFVRPLA